MKATRNKPPVPPLSARRHPRRLSHCAAPAQLSLSPRRKVINPNSIPTSPAAPKLPGAKTRTWATRREANRRQPFQGISNRIGRDATAGCPSAPGGPFTPVEPQSLLTHLPPRSQADTSSSVSSLLGPSDLLLTLNRFPATTAGDWRHTERLSGEAGRPKSEVWLQHVQTGISQHLSDGAPGESSPPFWTLLDKCRR